MRDIKLIVPELQELFTLFSIEMDRAQIRFIVTETLRTQARQDELYAQGRTKPGKIVTWTRKSPHVEGRAFDIAVLINGKATWDEEHYIRAGRLGEKVGLQWGIVTNGRHHDLVHYQLKETS